MWVADPNAKRIYKHLLCAGIRSRRDASQMLESVMEVER